MTDCSICLKPIEDGQGLKNTFDFGLIHWDCQKVEQ